MASSVFCVRCGGAVAANEVLSEDPSMSICPRCSDECPMCFKPKREKFGGFCSKRHLADAEADPT